MADDDAVAVVLGAVEREASTSPMRTRTVIRASSSTSLNRRAGPAGLIRKVPARTGRIVWLLVPPEKEVVHEMNDC